MKYLVFLLLITSAVPCWCQSLQDCYNNIGIFNTSAVDLAALGPGDYSHNDSEVSQFTAYVLLLNPYNENTGQEIQTVGGVEFRLEVPGELFVTPVSNFNCDNWGNPMEFYCGANIAVSGGQCVLLSLSVGYLTTEPQSFYITPISDPAGQSFPGDISIADRDDSFSASRATPVTRDFTQPVYTMFGGPPEALPGDLADCWVVPTESTSWGDIKAVFR